MKLKIKSLELTLLACLAGSALVSGCENKSQDSKWKYKGYQIRQEVISKVIIYNGSINVSYNWNNYSVMHPTISFTDILSNNWEIGKNYHLKPKLSEADFKLFKGFSSIEQNKGYNIFCDYSIGKQGKMIKLRVISSDGEREYITHEYSELHFPKNVLVPKEISIKGLETIYKYE